MTSVAAQGRGTTPPEVTVRMWEARVEPDRLAEARAWVREAAVPELLAAGAQRVEGFAAAAPEERVVCVSWWHETRTVDPRPPDGLLARAHGWDFTPLH